MTRAGEIASDIIILIVLVPVAGGALGWFFYKGLKTGVAETRNGNFARTERPGCFWTAIIGYGIGVLVIALAFVFVVFDLF